MSLTRPRGRRSPTWGAGSPGHCCRRLTTDLSPGKVLEASVFSGPSFGRRVRSRGPETRSWPARMKNVTLPPHTSCSTQHSHRHPGTRKAVPPTWVRPDCQKEYLIEIRNARWVRCQGDTCRRVTASTHTVLYRPLTNWLLVPYRNGRHLVARGPISVRLVQDRRRKGGRKGESSP